MYRNLRCGAVKPIAYGCSTSFPGCLLTALWRLIMGLDRAIEIRNQKVFMTSGKFDFIIPPLLETE